MEFKTGQLYRTRDGRKAQIFMLDNGDEYMLGAVFNASFGLWGMCSWRMDGCWYDKPHELDLISEWSVPIERKTTAWVDWCEPSSSSGHLERLGIKVICLEKISEFQHKVEITVKELSDES